MVSETVEGSLGLQNSPEHGRMRSTLVFTPRPPNPPPYSPSWIMGQSYWVFFFFALPLLRYSGGVKALGQNQQTQPALSYMRMWYLHVILLQ